MRLLTSMMKVDCNTNKMKATPTTVRFPKCFDSFETVLSIKTATTLHWEIFNKENLSVMSTKFLSQQDRFTCLS